VAPYEGRTLKWAHMIETGSERLRRLCVEYRVPASVEDALKRQAGYIAAWRSKVLPVDRTPTQRANALKRIETMAEKLKKEIEGLTFADRWVLDDVYFDLEGPRFFDALESGADLTQLDLGGFVLPELQRAAATVRSRIPGVGKAGAQPLTERQADFIRCIAQSVKPAGLVPASTGKFYELCAAVFDAGGMTMPDRALRYFMKTIRPQLFAAGYCL
jgi:hypothetical protein